MAVLGKAVGEGLADRDFVEVVRQILPDLAIDLGPNRTMWPRRIEMSGAP